MLLLSEHLCNGGGKLHLRVFFGFFCRFCFLLAESAVLLGDTLRAFDSSVSGGLSGPLLRVCTPAPLLLGRVSLIKVPEKHANKGSTGKRGAQKIAFRLNKGIVFW